MRGGVYAGTAGHARSAERDDDYPGAESPFVGFRLVRTVN